MQQLWGERVALFPNLVFCAGVEAQLVAVHYSDPHFRQIITKLLELQSYFEDWRAGGFDPKAMTKCNPTSRQTLEHREYGSSYIFLNPAGGSVVCGWHLYLTPGAWRIYFAPDATSRRGIVAHVGVKLPGVRYGVI